MTKIRQDNNVTDCIGLVYTKTKIKLLGPIWLSVVSYENQIGQWCDQSYRYGLIENEIELSWPIRTGVICDETRQDNDVTDRTGAFYANIKTKLS